MSVKFQCSSCKVVKAINPRMLGREIACPECGSPVQLPTQEQIDAAQRRREQQKSAASLQAALQAATRRAESKSKPAKSHSEHDEEKNLAAAEASFSKPKPVSGEDMDMTPMVDVTFLLLIFFMVTASFSVQKSVSRPPPREEDPSVNAVQKDIEEDKDPVTVQIDEFNAYNVITNEGERIVASKQDLIVALEQARSGSAAGKVVIKAHQDCIHASVIAALDAGREAEFETFEVSTVEEFE